jgi:hypothetical protein
MKAGRMFKVTVLVLLLIAEHVRANATPPGYSRVMYEVCFDNLGDYPAYAFFLTPVQILEVEEAKLWTPLRDTEFPVRINAGEPFRLGNAGRIPFRWVVIAIPRPQIESAGDRFDWTRARTNNPDVLFSNEFRFTDYEYVLVVDPKESNRHHFRVDITDGKLTVTQTSVETVRNPVVVLFWLGVSVVLAWVGIRWMRRRRARRAAAIASPDGVR